MEKLYLPWFTLTSDIGLALPKAYTKRPISVCVPDFCTSSHDGRLLPDLSTVRSHRPITSGSLIIFCCAADWLTASMPDNKIPNPVTRKARLTAGGNEFFMFEIIGLRIKDSFLFSPGNK